MTLGKAVARRTDPATSHEAARRVERVGKADSQRQHVLGVLLWTGRAMTCWEIAEWGGFKDAYAPARRLPELEAQNLVERMLPRPCEVKGTLCQTWAARERP